MLIVVWDVVVITDLFGCGFGAGFFGCGFGAGLALFIAFGSALFFGINAGLVLLLLLSRFQVFAWCFALLVFALLLFRLCLLLCCFDLRCA